MSRQANCPSLPVWPDPLTGQAILRGSSVGRVPRCNIETSEVGSSNLSPASGCYYAARTVPGPALTGMSKRVLVPRHQAGSASRSRLKPGDSFCDSDRGGGRSVLLTVTFQNPAFKPAVRPGVPGENNQATEISG